MNRLFSLTLVCNVVGIVLGTIFMSAPARSQSTTSPLIPSTTKIAQSFPTLPINSSNCTCDPKDPFNPSAKMPAGPFQGLCLNNCSQRSIKLLSGAEANTYNTAPNMIVFANFKHKDKFWVAKIPQDAVEDVIFQIQFFNILPSRYNGHGQLRFRLKPGSEAILVPQVKGSLETEVRLSELTYSANAIWIQGGVWDPLSGLFDVYAIAHEFISLEDRVQNVVKFPFTQGMEQYKLALTHEQKQKLLANALLQSDLSGTSLMYNTIQRNCTTESLRAIDSVIPPNVSASLFIKPEIFVNVPVSVFGGYLLDLLQRNQLDSDKFTQIVVTQLQRFPELKDFQPTAPFDAIQRRGLVNSSSKIPNLEEEFNLELKKSNPLNLGN